MRSVNQNHNLYVVKGVVTGDNSVSSLGDIKAVTGGEGMDKHLYFQYMGRDGVTKSDIIPLNQISYVKYVPATAQVDKMRKVKIELTSAVLNSNDSNNVYVGEDYIMNIVFHQFYGPSPEYTYVKTAGVHVTSSNKTVDGFFSALADELNACFAREVGAEASSNPYLTFTASADDDCLYIEEKPQTYALGKGEPDRVLFDVTFSPILIQGEEVEWGTATEVTSGLTEVQNSKKMAELEWFTFGERADVYRGAGYPNEFVFTPMVEANAQYGYDALEIHYAYQGTCEDIQKSEKDITLIAKAASGGHSTELASLGDVLSGSDMLGSLSGNKVATPVIVVDGSNANKITAVNCATQGATIRTTGAGSSPADPTAATNAWNGTAVTLTNGQSIKFIATAPGMAPSEIVSQSYSS